MGLIHKHDPVGVDVVIDKLQRDLFLELTVNFGWRDYDSYPRAYRNKKNENVIPEVYVGKNEYKEVLFNDKETVTSFFLSGDKRVYSEKTFTFEQEIAWIYQANLSKLFPDVHHRADEEMINNVVLALEKKYWEQRFTEVITGVDNVYQSLKLNYDKKYYDDMSAFCVARFNFKLLYINNCCGVQPLR